MSRDTSTIVKNADGSCTRTTKYAKVYNFNSSGQLTSIVDRNGNTTTLTYTGSNLTGITDSTGRTAVLSVSGGKITSVTDFSNHTWSISYSAAGSVFSIADPLGNTWNFQYDSNNRMVQKNRSVQQCRFIHLRCDKRDADLHDRSQQHGNKHSLRCRRRHFRCNRERWWGVGSPVQYSVQCAPGDHRPLRQQTTYAYDSNNNLLSITYPDGTSKSFTYDSNRNVTSVTDAGGRKTNLTYNSQNRVTAIQNPAGGTANITYDAKGNVSSYKDPTGALHRSKGTRKETSRA